MNIGLIGLGRMGLAIAHRLLAANIEVVGFDTNNDAMHTFACMGGNAAHTIADVARKTDKIWLMLPAGTIIDDVINNILSIVQPQSIIIDGGNSKFTDSIERAQRCAQQDVFYLDCGTSGGLHGESLGFSLMVGGSEEAFLRMLVMFKLIANADGVAYVGPSGAGHYVKMVHNGIEYALLQAYAEGFHLLKDGYYKDLDLEKISNVWLHGSIIRSWIVQLAHDVFKRDQTLAHVSGFIGGGQTGTWTVEEAQRQGISVPLIKEALHIRQQTHADGGNYATKVVAMLRQEFGGHEVKKNS